MVLPKDGNNVVLTIDSVIQYIAERELDKAYITSNAKAASIVVMNPRTGAILALANRPTFDLNNYSSAPGMSDGTGRFAICSSRGLCLR